MKTTNIYLFKRFYFFFPPPSIARNLINRFRVAVFEKNVSFALKRIPFFFFIIFFFPVLCRSCPRYHSGRIVRRRRFARARDDHQSAPFTAARRRRPAARGAGRRTTTATTATRTDDHDHHVRPGLQARGRARRVRVHGPRQIRRVGPALRAQAGGVEAGRQGGQVSWMHSGRLNSGAVKNVRVPARRGNWNYDGPSPRTSFRFNKNKNGNVFDVFGAREHFGYISHAYGG